jgi:GntR family transcriptional regulator, rspAB operon transcriptional repressor
LIGFNLRVEDPPTKPAAAPEAAAGSPKALAEMVAGRLREEIVAGRLAPNERIKQAAVAERLEVSRLPVREALQQLAGEGLVSLERDVGARVTPLDPAELIEVYLVREALEPVLVRHAAERIGPERLAVARAINEESERCAGRGDSGGYLSADRRFHTEIFEATEMPRAYSIIIGMLQTSERYRRALSILPHGLETSVVEHRMILEAIERGAAEDAGELHRVHVRRTRLTLAEHPELFQGDPEVDTGSRDEEGR